MTANLSGALPVSLNLRRLSEYSVVSIDCETTGLYWYKDKLFGIAVAAFDGEHIHADYFDIRTPRGQKALNTIKDQAPHINRVVNHAIKFDAHFLQNEGVLLPFDRMECTSVRAALINEHELSFSLDALSKKYLNAAKVDVYEELAGLFGGKADRESQIKNLHRAPESLARKYAIMDPELAIRLWLWQEDEIKRQGLEQVWGLERKITPILVQIERHGVRVDEELAERSMGKIDSIVNTAQRALNALAGNVMNANSPPQMRKLFGICKRDADGPKGYEWVTNSGMLVPMTESGEASLAKDTLVIMANLGDERAQHVLTLRKMIKAKSFLKDHILGHAIDGRVYPNYNQTRGPNDLGTGTGRFSIDDPALQQIPSRDVDVAEIVRSCFLPEYGNKWCCADWAQFEFRWFSHYTKDPNILKAYNDDPDTDYHQIVSNITSIPRKPRFAGDANAKQINLGLVFGMGQGKMAYEMGLDYSIRYGDDGREWYNAGPIAKEIFNSYHNAIPGVSKLLQEASSIAKSRGYVKTVMGRHIRFPQGMYTHKAGGLVFQGTSADCMKQKMVELWPYCTNNGIKMLLSVHDELDFSIPESGAEERATDIKQQLEVFDGSERHPIFCRVPIRSQVELANNWFDASK